jgi:electron transport complex protein RnfB
LLPKRPVYALDREASSEESVAHRIIDTCIGCTACVRCCPTGAISGLRDAIHVIDPGLCIDCGACGVVCPPEAILDEDGDVCRNFPRRDWPKAVVIEERCIGRGCEQCINICPFDALYLDAGDGKTGDFFGAVRLAHNCSTPCRLCEQTCVLQILGSCRAPRRLCRGCGLCEQVCGWEAIHVEPPREALKKRIYRFVPPRRVRHEEEEGVVWGDRYKAAA